MSPPASNTSSSKAPGWANILQRCNQWLMFDVGGGPRPFKLATIINIQKAGSLPFFALLIWFYSTRTEAATSATAWIYLALHGGYGINWLIKDLLFPDPKWQQRSTIEVHGRPAVAVTVGYLSPHPAAGSGPFLAEERSLLEEIAHRVGRFVERAEADEAQRHLEAAIKSGYPASFGAQ